MPELEQQRNQHYAERIDNLLLPETSKADKLAILAELAEPEALHEETLEKLIGAVRASMPEESAHFRQSINFVVGAKLIDCCGTGGSGLSHFNTSTTVAFILAAAGLHVAKFGNRAASSQSGSFDLLHALGVGEPLSMPALADLLQEVNLAFLFAPQFYPQLAPLAPLRKELGRKTIFNYIGPLLNPTDPPYRLLGVPNSQAQALVAAHLASRAGTRQAFVVSADSGLDEIDVQGPSTILKVRRNDSNSNNSDKNNSNKNNSNNNNKNNSNNSNKIGNDNNNISDDDADTASAANVTSHREAADFLQKLGLLMQGNAGQLLTVSDNAEIFASLLHGRLDKHNYYHALVCLNAGAGLQAAELVEDLETGYMTAAKLLAEGTALAKYNQYKARYKKLLKTQAGVCK